MAGVDRAVVGGDRSGGGEEVNGELTTNRWSAIRNARGITASWRLNAEPRTERLSAEVMAETPQFPDSPAGEITLLLQRAGSGDAQAADQILPLVYGELRKLAAARMARESPGQTLQATALVHEAWLRLGGDAQPDWKSRAQFFWAAAEAMRRILIDNARRRRALRHGG